MLMITHYNYFYSLIKHESVYFNHQNKHICTLDNFDDAIKKNSKKIYINFNRVNNVEMLWSSDQTQDHFHNVSSLNK